MLTSDLASSGYPGYRGILFLSISLFSAMFLLISRFVVSGKTAANYLSYHGD